MNRYRIAIAAALLAPILTTPAFAAPNTQWTSATVLKGEVVIPAGQVVTVAANSAIKVADGTQITVKGTLNAPAGLSLTGKSWIGLIIAGSATLTNFTESGPGTPFRVNAKANLTIHGGNISGIKGNSVVEGTLIADGLNYDKGPGAGIISSNGTGAITIDHSTLTGSGRSSGDFFGLYGTKSITLTNSSMTGAHCAFHVTGVENMKLDNDTISGNAYGFMMYGSSTTGSRTISNTTIKDNNFGFDEGSASTRNGPITISHSTITGNGTNLGLFTGKVKINSH